MTPVWSEPALPPVDAAGAALDAALEQALQPPDRPAAALAQGSPDGVEADGGLDASVVDELAVAVVTDLGVSDPAVAGSDVATAASRHGGLELTALEQRRIGFYATSAKAAATRRAYLGAWRGFTDWATASGRSPLPASGSTVAAFLSYLADTGASLATVVRHHAAVRHAHVLAGEDLPTSSAAVAEVMTGIRRTLGQPPRGKDPLLTPDLALLISAIDRADPDHGLAALRDRALLLVAFTTALRRSELAALTWPDLTIESPTTDGTDAAALVVTVRRSKTDQTGNGRTVGVLRSPDPAGRLCPVRALLAYRAALTADLHTQHPRPVEVSGNSSQLDGPVFRPVTRHGHVGVPGRGSGDRLSGAAIADIVKRHARAAGLDPAVLAAHSLRSGHATQAAKNGASELAIAEQLGHQHLQTTRRYIRRARAADDSTSGYLGL